MCGICGIVGKITDGHQHIITRMNDAIFHRGPDDDGQFGDCFVQLSMRRLSIIDLYGGKQPIFNEDKKILAFQNGEIYNFQALRDNLISKGHTFSSNSDTEVHVHLYEEYGDQMFEHLKGMFAVCIYDIRKNKVIIGRDRFGEKPLFYHYKNGNLSFSSEIPSLLKSDIIIKKLNKDALAYLFKFGYLPEPLTLIEDVQSLPPGHFMTIEVDSICVKPYFDIVYKPNFDFKSDEEVSEQLLPLLKQAVSKQTISDVPIGAFLSGGIDSSSIVALLQMDSLVKIKTFNVKFEESSYDESPIAREVATHLGTDHHELFVPNQEFSEDIFWKIIDHVGMPFTDTSAIPTYFITKEIRKHVKVALSGDGGDELFGGYSTYAWWVKLRKWQKNELLPIGALAPIFDLMQKSPFFSKSSKLRQLSKASKFIGGSKDAMARNLLEMCDDQQVRQLFKNRTFDSYSHFHNLVANTEFPSELREIMHYRLKFNLPSDMLIKVDRMSMANSLEVRAPFLDADLFNFSTTLPDNFLFHGGKGKYILRETMKPFLPESVFNHPKSGFGIPIHTYMNDEYINLCNKLIRKDHPLNEILDYNHVSKMVKFGIENKKDTANLSVFKSGLQLWMLLQLYGWVDRFKIEI